MEICFQVRFLFYVRVCSLMFGAGRASAVSRSAETSQPLQRRPGGGSPSVDVSTKAVRAGSILGEKTQPASSLLPPPPRELEGVLFFLQRILLRRWQRQHKRLIAKVRNSSNSSRGSSLILSHVLSPPNQLMCGRNPV